MPISHILLTLIFHSPCHKDSIFVLFHYFQICSVSFWSVDYSPLFYTHHLYHCWWLQHTVAASGPFLKPFFWCIFYLYKFFKKIIGFSLPRGLTLISSAWYTRPFQNGLMISIFENSEDTSHKGWKIWTTYKVHIFEDTKDLTIFLRFLELRLGKRQKSGEMSLEFVLVMHSDFGKR